VPSNRIFISRDVIFDEHVFLLRPCQTVPHPYPRHIPLHSCLTNLRMLHIHMYCCLTILQGLVVDFTLNFWMMHHRLLLLIAAAWDMQLLTSIARPQSSLCRMPGHLLRLRLVPSRPHRPRPLMGRLRHPRLRHRQPRPVMMGGLPQPLWAVSSTPWSTAPATDFYADGVSYCCPACSWSTHS
jgi:hypothetical protein